MDNKDLIFNFKTSLKHDKKVFRVIEVKGSITLAHFAKAILAAFGFENDHAFGFYNNIKNSYDSSEAYTLFFDTGHPVESNEKSVRRTHVCQVFQPGKKMIFLFDYGDEWFFLLECLGISSPIDGKTYPIVTKEKGTAPKQYQNESDDSLDDDLDDDE